jgi:hypothetical protein
MSILVASDPELDPVPNIRILIRLKSSDPTKSGPATLLLYMAEFVFKRKKTLIV